MCTLWWWKDCTLAHRMRVLDHPVFFDWNKSTVKFARYRIWSRSKRFFSFGRSFVFRVWADPTTVAMKWRKHMEDWLRERSPLPSKKKKKKKAMHQKPKEKREPPPPSHPPRPPPSLEKKIHNWEKDELLAHASLSPYIYVVLNENNFDEWRILILNFINRKNL